MFLVLSSHGLETKPELALVARVEVNKSSASVPSLSSPPPTSVEMLQSQSEPSVAAQATDRHFGWRPWPSLVGWRPSLLGWRPSLVIRVEAIVAAQATIPTEHGAGDVPEEARWQKFLVVRMFFAGSLGWGGWGRRTGMSWCG